MLKVSVVTIVAAVDPASVKRHVQSIGQGIGYQRHIRERGNGDGVLELDYERACRRNWIGCVEIVIKIAPAHFTARAFVGGIAIRRIKGRGVICLRRHSNRLAACALDRYRRVFGVAGRDHRPMMIIGARQHSIQSIHDSRACLRARNKLIHSRHYCCHIVAPDVRKEP